LELTFAQQSTAFLYSILLGIAFGVIYGPLKAIRVTFSLGKVSVFIIDFLYMIFLCVTIFYFSLAFVQGYIRIYIFVGVFLGAIAYRATLGKLFFKFYFPIMKFIKKGVTKISLKIKKIAKKLLKYSANLLYNVIKIRDSKKINVDDKSELKNKTLDDSIKVMSSNEKSKAKIRKDSRKN
jgi:hypothetical protein